MTIIVKQVRVQIKTVEIPEVEAQEKLAPSLEIMRILRQENYHRIFPFKNAFAKRKSRKPFKKTVLIIDKDGIERKLAESSLKDQGYRVITCSSRRECVDVIKNSPVDLILSERILPDADGWELLEQVKNHEDGKLIKTAFLTFAKEMSASRISHMRERGIDDYINKPFKPQEFVNRVNRMLVGDEKL